MNPIYPIAALAGFGYLALGGNVGMGAGVSNDWNLPDVDASDQGGVFKRDFDSYFEKASGRHGVPFALVKAHAIRESSLNANAYNVEGSRGLMQIYWPQGSNRLAVFGYGPSELGDGAILFDPDVNTDLGAAFIADNLKTCGGNLRDAINMYNTGKKEAVFKAPKNYVDDILGYYSQIVGRKVS